MVRGENGHWGSRVGAWLGIGTSPAALAMGAGIAARHDGPPSLLTVALGAAVMAVLLYPNGIIGVRRPHGQGMAFADVLRRHLGPRGRQAVSALLAGAMIGWYGFSVGLGGAALNALLSLPAPAGQLLLAVPLTLLALGGIARWNGPAVVATASVLVLCGAIALLLAEPRAPVTLRRPTALGADLAIFAGYVAGFAIRAPDFTVGLRRRADLLVSIAVLVATTVAVSLVGAALHIAQGGADVVDALAAPGGLALGNALLVVAVVAPALTNLHSGALSLTALTGAGQRLAVFGIALPGMLLGVLRFDRGLTTWLGVLAGTMTPLLVPLAVAAWQSRRGRPPRRLPLWTWLPASLLAGGMAAVRAPGGIAAGLLLSAAAVSLWGVRGRGQDPAAGPRGEGPPQTPA